MILSNQPARFLGYKHWMNQVLNLWEGGEIRNKVNDLIKKGKCPKCNNYVFLGNDNHISIMLLIIDKIVCNFYSNAYPFI